MDHKIKNFKNKNSIIGLRNNSWAFFPLQILKCVQKLHGFANCFFTTGVISVFNVIVIDLMYDLIIYIFGLLK